MTREEQADSYARCRVSQDIFDKKELYLSEKDAFLAGYDAREEEITKMQTYIKALDFELGNANLRILKLEDKLDLAAEALCEAITELEKIEEKQ